MKVDEEWLQVELYINGYNYNVTVLDAPSEQFNIRAVFIDKDLNVRRGSYFPTGCFGYGKYYDDSGNPYFDSVISEEEVKLGTVVKATRGQFTDSPSGIKLSRRVEGYEIHIDTVLSRLRDKKNGN